MSDTWLDNSIQFPRLIAEITATQDKLNLDALAASMDLPVEKVIELFDRAQNVWEMHTSAIPAHIELEEEHQLQLQEGHLYRLKSGAIVGPLMPDTKQRADVLTCMTDEGPCSWFIDGGTCTVNHPPLHIVDHLETAGRSVS